MIVDDYDIWQQNKTAPVNECHFALINDSFEIIRTDVRTHTIFLIAALVLVDTRFSTNMVQALQYLVLVIIQKHTNRQTLLFNIYYIIVISFFEVILCSRHLRARVRR